jgi:putative transposase
MSRRFRLPDDSYVGHVQFFLTICTDHRTPVFSRPTVADTTMWHFLQVAASESISILAYCAMPDHVHMLVEGTTPFASCRRFVRFGKQRSGFWFLHTHHQRLWRPGYWDVRVRDGFHMMCTLRYILANPVRAGLVSDPADYPHWGSEIWSRDELLDLCYRRTPRT